MASSDMDTKWGRCYRYRLLPRRLFITGINEQVDQNEFGASRLLNIVGRQHDGKITMITLIATEDGTGAILGNAITLYFFRSDPVIGVGDADLSIADANACIGKIEVYEGDWETFASSGIATITPNFPYTSDGSGSIYCACVNRSATSYNSAAGDDEQLEFSVTFEVLV